MKMSKSELINSASEDENYGSEENETSVQEYMWDFTKPQLYMFEPSVCDRKLTRIRIIRFRGRC